MVKTTRILAVLFLACALLPAQELAAQVNGGGDILSEVPIWPVPSEMTLEEYRDANRRLGVGMFLMSVPIPGALHFYAGERREAWMHVGAAGLGLVSIIAGAALLDEKDTWEESDFEIVDVVGQSGETKRYEKIPIEEEAGQTNYKLRELDHEMDGGGVVLVALGAGLIVGQVLHDWIDGVYTIERKRDAVRYKYGKTAGYGLSLNPSVDPRRGTVGAQLSLNF